MERLVAVQRRREVRRREGERNEKRRGVTKTRRGRSHAAAAGSHAASRAASAMSTACRSPSEPQRLDREPGEQRGGGQQRPGDRCGRRSPRPACDLHERNRDGRRRGSTSAAASRAAASGCAVPAAPRRRRSPGAEGWPRARDAGARRAGSRASVRPATPHTACARTRRPPHRTAWGASARPSAHVGPFVRPLGGVHAGAEGERRTDVAARSPPWCPGEAPRRSRASGPARRDALAETGRSASGLAAVSSTAGRSGGGGAPVRG